MHNAKISKQHPLHISSLILSPSSDSDFVTQNPIDSRQKKILHWKSFSTDARHLETVPFPLNIKGEGILCDDAVVTTGFYCFVQSWCWCCHHHHQYCCTLHSVLFLSAGFENGTKRILIAYTINGSNLAGLCLATFKWWKRNGPECSIDATEICPTGRSFNGLIVAGFFAAILFSCNRLLFNRIDTLIITTVKQVEKNCQTKASAAFYGSSRHYGNRSKRQSRTMALAVRARESDYDFSKPLSTEQIHTHTQHFPGSIVFRCLGGKFLFLSIFPAPLIRLADFPTYGFWAIFFCFRRTNFPLCHTCVCVWECHFPPNSIVLDSRESGW